MELNQLTTLRGIVRAGSFTKAADTLHLSQPALSLQIKALEDELGVQLFERRNRQVYLTEIGRLVLSRAEQILGLVEQIHQDVAVQQGLQSGQVRIGTSDTTCLYLLPPVVQSFRQRSPAIDIHLTNKPSGEVVALLKEGRVDFGIVTLPVGDPHVEETRLLWREEVIICPPEHPLAQVETVTPQHMADTMLLLLEESSTSRTLLDQFFVEAEITPTIMELGSIEVIKRYVEIGLGISVVPRLAVQAEVTAGRLQALITPWLTPRAIGVVTRRGGFLAPASQVFIKLLREQLTSS